MRINFAHLTKNLLSDLSACSEAAPNTPKRSWGGAAFAFNLKNHTIRLAGRVLPNSCYSLSWRFN
jgi:hypothetical protein